MSRRQVREGAMIGRFGATQNAPARLGEGTYRSNHREICVKGRQKLSRGSLSRKHREWWQQSPIQE